ncbi:MAG: ParB/RepB/Spo0J family partition protein [Ignavibacteriaceae bacterium]|nr:ParB/RepB/Spo0J family partition protein [Ignavibacteriaceae bacterium]
MSKSKLVLGRGLDALIKVQRDIETRHETEPAPAIVTDTNVNFRNLDVELIDPNPFQPRTVFDQKPLDELKVSILKNGLITPVTVRNFNNRYQLISGERRLRAFKEIGYPEIPAYIINVESDDVMLAMALIENIQREKLNPVEIGIAYRRLMEDCGLTQDEIADRVGKDRSTIANSLRILKLPEEIKQKLITEEISMGQARALINLPEKEKQIYVLGRILQDNLSVRKVESLVRELLSGEAHAKKKKKIQTIDGSTVKSYELRDIEDRLKRLLGTKVSCRLKKDGSGEIIIEYYSSQEFEGIVEQLFTITK